MSRTVDNLIALRILSMLVTPFNKSEAFKLGIINASGKVLKQTKELVTDKEKDSYDYLHRLVFNLKRLLNKLPGGDTYTKNLVAAYFLIRESYETYNTHDVESRFITIVESIKTVSMVEEEIIVNRFLEDIANVTTGIANPELPLFKKKSTKKVKSFIIKRK